MIRYSVIVTMFGEPTYIPGANQVELHVDKEGLVVKWEEVQQYLRQISERLHTAQQEEQDLESLVKEVQEVISQLTIDSK